MRKKSVLSEKSFLFGLQVVSIGDNLHDIKKQTLLTNQFVRAGTAVGALIREAEFAQSRADFIHKLTISLKEANETDYWLKIFKENRHIEEDTFNAADQLLQEIIKMLVTSIKTAKKNAK